MRESLKTMENGNYIQNYIHIYIQKEAVFHFQERSIAVLCMFGLYFFVLCSDRLLAAETGILRLVHPRKNTNWELVRFTKVQTHGLCSHFDFYCIVSIGGKVVTKVIF